MGRVKQSVDSGPPEGRARKPEEEASSTLRHSRPVVPAPRIYWARRVHPEELAGRLAVHLSRESCEHVSTRHCGACIWGHLVDVIEHLSGKDDPNAS